MLSLDQTLPKVNIGRILGRLKHVRKTSRGWTALCPAHPDRNPSLSVAVGDDGRVLLRCFAGCSFGEIVRALGFNPHDLSPGRLRPCTPEERRQAAEQTRQRELERGFRSWCDQSYLIAAFWFRTINGELNSFDDYCNFSGLVHSSPVIGHHLNVLQFGADDDRIALYQERGRHPWLS